MGMSILWNKEKKWKLLIITFIIVVHLYFFILYLRFFFLSLIISASLTMGRRVIEIENEAKHLNTDENNFSLKTLLLSYGISFFLLIHFFTIYDLYKKPFLYIEYRNNNINQEIVKNKEEIINDIINENVLFGHNHDLKYFTYEFEITEEEANELKSAKEKFDKRNKEIEQENENKAKTGNVKFTD